MVKWQDWSNAGDSHMYLHGVPDHKSVPPCMGCLTTRVSHLWNMGCLITRVSHLAWGARPQKCPTLHGVPDHKSVPPWWSPSCTLLRCRCTRWWHNRCRCVSSSRWSSCRVRCTASLLRCGTPLQQNICLLGRYMKPRLYNQSWIRNKYCYETIRKCTIDRYRNTKHSSFK